MPARLALFIALLFTPFLTFAQTTYSAAGHVVDAKDTSALIGVTVVLINSADTTSKSGTVTDVNGDFKTDAVAPGTYKMQLNYVGYKTLERTITIADKDFEAGTLGMRTQANELKSAIVTGKQIRAEQKGDTSSFNADAYKTHPDATAEDLITKMPGITSDNNGVKVNGESVQQVYVDGKPFFGTDPTLAMKNLPAEVIDKIQVYDKLSDQSSFTGFDDGTAQKTINIVTKKNKSNGVFGKAYAGYGTDDRYIAGGNLNIFNGDQRITILGLSNNINQQNFSSQDVLGISGGSGSNRGGGGGSGRGGGGGGNNFMVGQQGGITTTNSFGLNYSDNWGKKIKVSGSYFFNGTDNTTQTDIVRNYFTTSDTNNIYHETDHSETKNFNHRFNLRFEYTIDSYNSIIFTPGVSFQQNNSISRSIASDSLGDAIASYTNNTNTANNHGYSSSDNLLFQHKFKKPRRTLSVNVNASLNEKTGDGTYLSDNEFYFPRDSTLRDQHYSLYNNSYNVGGNINYTEPIGKKGQLMFNYSPSIQKSDADKDTYDKSAGSQQYDSLDALFSNRYNNTYTTQKGGVNYRIGDKKINFSVGANAQYATLDGKQEFPNVADVNKPFFSVLPNAMLNYKYADGRNLRIMYRTNTQAPSITQLENVIDISNPLLLKTGNANLKQDYEQTLILRYGLTKAKTARNFFINLYATYIQDYIGNATYLPINGDSTYRDSFTHSDIQIHKGSQLTRPVNVDGYVNLRSFVTYGFPVDAIKSNLNFNGGFNFTRTPGIVNTTLNFSNNYIPSAGFVLSSNISTNLDFTLSYSGNYNIVTNTIQTQANNNYYNHVASFKINYIFLKNFVVNTNIAENYYTSFSGTGDQNFFLWNAYVGYKFLKNQAMEARISAYDILNQNKSITRTVTETYVENNVTQVLRQYFMFQLTYTIRNFKGALPAATDGGDDRGPRGSGPGGPPPGGGGPGGPPPGGGGFR